MRALYSLVCRLRTFSALTQGTLTLVLDGWAALGPAQLLLLGCGLGIALRVLIPSRASAAGGPRAAMDRLLSTVAAVSIIGLAAIGIAGPCVTLGRLVLGP